MNAVGQTGESGKVQAESVTAVTVEAMVFTKIATNDIEGLARFCESALGFRVTARLENPMGPAHPMREFVLKLPSESVPRLILVHFPERPAIVPGEATIGLSVGDVDVAVAAALAAGGAVDVPAADLPAHGLRMAFIRTPQGHVVEFIQPLAR